MFSHPFLRGFCFKSWTVGILGVVVAFLSVTEIEAQIGRIRDAARRAAEREAARQADRAVTNAIRCTVGETTGPDECHRRARESGEEVVFVDADGQIITDDDGNPVTHPEALPARYRTQAGPAPEPGNGGDSPTPRPGEGAWANYDFVPGDRILFAEDFTGDRVGDFPRRLEFVRGNFEVVEWEGRRFLRATGGSNNDFRIRLQEPLPERFTIEFEVHLGFGSPGILDHGVLTEPYERSLANYGANYFKLGGRVGLAGRNVPTATINSSRLTEEIVPIRIMVDGTYAKMYVDEQRVANVPNAQLNRTDVLHFRLRGTEDRPSLITNLRVAAGGRDLYQSLAEEGRVVTRGIYFDTGSDRVRPESTGTLDEIARMLREHPDLRIRIEGHTDSVGSAESNQVLSERRAESVRRVLIETYGINPNRLETAGFGESRPVETNDTPEGRQNNRRVELVRL